MSKKTRDVLGNRVRKKQCFLAQNRTKIDANIEKKGARGQIRQKNAPWRAFLRKKSILGRFLGPRPVPK